MPCRPFLGHHQPAVARCVLTGHEARPGGGEHQDGAPKVFGGAETPKRAELATMLRTSLIVATLASVSSPRPPATVFTVRSWGAERRRQLAGEPEKGALGAGVVVVGDNGVVYQVRDDADDPAALLDHPRHDGLRAIQGTPVPP